ncbi:MAG: hypothetical protein JWP12_3087 [Bacteroidetes bacterium]|nr:hypothetical protein [Bacteroidota bacterium]
MKKIITLLFILTAFLNVGIAQHNWLQGAGSNANDEALDVTHDAQGNIYATGYFSQSARFDNMISSSAGLSDVFVSKQDSLGTFLWVAKAGGTQDDKAVALTVALSGEIYITGNYKGTAHFGSYTLTSTGGSQDIFVAKLDNSGNFVWAHSYGGGDVDIATDLVVDVNGNVTVAGQFKGVSNFGTFSFTSVNYPLTMPVNGGQPSFDAFIFKMNTSGTVSWAKQGAAVYDDRVLKLGVDDQSNIYVCGQFSDTLSFTNHYNNNAFNAGFLMKLDSNGTENWFRRMIATQFMVYDMAVEGNDVWLTGDFKGTMVYIGPPNSYINGTSANKTFVLKADASSGNYSAGTSESSDNEVSSRGIAVDAHNNVYTTGYFKCSFTPFSHTHGNGVFYSVGYRDVYVIKYDNTLSRQWEKQYGGIGDDYPTAMTVLNDDKPIVAGSYTKNFNATDGNHFTTHVNNLTTINSNIGNVICGNNLYGKFITQKGFGNKDILLAQPVDAACPLYDYFKRISGTCTLDTLMPQRFPLGDTMMACDRLLAYVTTPTTTDSLQAPEWSYHWTGGGTNDSIYFTTSGWKTITYGYADNCRNFVDSFYVQIDPTPSVPMINVYGVQSMEAIPVAGCLKKALLYTGDTATLVASGIAPGNTYHWTLPDGTIVSSVDTIRAGAPGVYSLSVTSPNGFCSNENCVTVYQWNAAGIGGSLSAFVPQIIFTNNTFNTSDTVRICKNDLFEMQLVDSTIHASGSTTTLFAFTTWNLSGGYEFHPYDSFVNTFGTHTQNFQADSTTNCTVTATVLDPATGAPLLTISRNFFLEVHEAPSNVPVISGLSFFCPGDTVLLTASGGDNYIWNGPGIVQSSHDSAFVNLLGTYGISSTTLDPVLGCPKHASTTFNLGSMPAPLITMYPAHGVICPLDSVLLTAETGGTYMWYGPTGTVIATTQSVYVHTPGIYYYTFISATGCSLVSEMAEVKQYSTPYIDAFPGTSLCATGTVLITALTDPSTILNWSAPLSGSAFTQVISSAGTYTVSANFCNITTIANITITNAAGTPVDLIYTGRDTICAQDTLVLLASNGYSNYTWYPAFQESQSYSTTGGGTFYVQAQNAEGCLSSDSITVYTLPAVVAPVTADTIVCAGSSVSLTASATGTLLWYSDLYGGSLVATGTSITANAGQSDTTFYVAASNGTCSSARTPLTVNIINGSQIPVITGNATACVGDTLSLSVNAPVSGVSYTWNGPATSAVTTTQLIIYPVTAAQAGNYTVYASNGVCTSGTDSITVNVNTIHLQAFATNSYTICQYDSVQLQTDTLTGTYLWNTGATGNSVYANQNTSNYFYTYTNSFGCTATSDTVHLNLIPAPVLLTMADTTVCTSSPLNFIATTDSSLMLTWYDELHNLLSVGTSYAISSVNQATVIAVQATGANGCASAWDSIHIAIQTPITAPLLSVNDTVCEGGTLNLSATGLPGYSYYWNGPNDFSSTDVNPVIPMLAANANGTYTLYVVNGYCSSDTGHVDIALFPMPLITASADTAICIGAEATLTASSSEGNLLWNTGDTTVGITVAPTTSTNYVVQTTNACATVTHTVHVSINALPDVSAGSDVTILLGETAALNASGGATYSWSPDNGLSCSECPNPGATITASQYYYVTVTDSNNCSSGDSVSVNVLNVNAIYIPTAFSPNGDGLNDEFKVQGNNISEFKMLIYDRWGTKVFESSDVNVGWNGQYKGKPSDLETYVYKINVTMDNGESRKYSGALTVLK